MPKVSYSTVGQDPRLEPQLKTYNSDKTHNDLGFVEPLIALTPAIGPSEVMLYSGDYFSLWKNKIIMSSLKAQSLFIITLNESFNKINHIEKIHIGSRIRDFIVTEEGMYLVLEGRYQNKKILLILVKLLLSNFKFYLLIYIIFRNCLII